MQSNYMKKNRIFKAFLSLLLVGVVLFGLYVYKLHSLAVEGNKIFAYRCTNVNPPLIGYKKSFLVMADYFNDPDANQDTDVGTAFENYNSGMRAYVEEENKWLDMQRAYMNRWDFNLIEPWYIQQAAEYQWKMYEGYRDDAKYLITQFGPVFDETDLVNIDNYNAAFRLLIKGETSKPFNIATYPPSKGNPEVARLIKEYSRAKYGRDRAKVEEQLYQRLQKSF